MRECNPTIIKLAAPWDDPQREYSGAAVYHDSVILMPQYPERTGNRIPMFPIQALLTSRADEIEQTPQTLLWDDDGLGARIQGFEGFESLGFFGNDVFVTIESHRSTGMMGYLVRGKIIVSDSSVAIKLDAATLVELPTLANLANTSDEAIVILPTGRLLTFFEANGASVVRNPVAYMFDISRNQVKRLPDVPIPNIEYRITDCSPADVNGKFWCLNCMYPGDETKLNPADDYFAERWGTDQSQKEAWKAGNRVVERLVELQFDGAEVRRTDHPPIYLKIRNDGLHRNWESLALATGHGFFIATDKYPTTLFAFVASE